MHAWIRTVYGPPEVLRLADVPVPAPGPGEVRVRVHGTSVAAGDHALLTARPRLVRLAFGLLRPRNPVVGIDLAGTVDAVGPGVTGFGPGDAVFGEVIGGACAELAVVKAAHLAHAPAGLDLVDAAALPVAGCTALQALRGGAVGPGTRVLVVGGSGGVGTLAVQLARALGAHVTAVVRAHHRDLAATLGADAVLDAADDDWTRSTWEVVVDLVGDRPLPTCGRALVSGGRYVAVSGAGGDWLGPIPRLLTGVLGGLGWGRRFVPLTAHATTADLDVLRGHVEAGRLRPVITRRVPFDAVPDAYRAFTAGSKRGRIVIDVASAAGSPG